MIVRQTTAQEAQRVDELFAVAFEQPMDRTAQRKEDSRVHPWAAFTDDEKNMMSNFLVSDFDVNFDGNVCKMGGIGGVATLPQYRRRGGIRGCFNAALPWMYENGYDFSYLYPFSTAYYRKFGYECGVQTLMATVDLSFLKLPAWDGYFCLTEASCPMTGEIRAVDQVWEKKYNMMVCHSGDDYSWTREVDPAAKQEFTYVCFTADGRPNAYTTFKLVLQPDGRNLVCSRFAFVDKDGYTGLMHLFQSLAADHKYVKFLVPNEPAMQYLMPEWSFGAAQWTVRPAGMVRVVNVRAALEKAAYRGTGAVTLEVHDRQIQQNDGIFRVEFENGKALSVTETGESPDAVLEIPTFSALLSGVSEFGEARQWMDGLEIKKENPGLCQVFYRKPMMLVDYF